VADKNEQSAPQGVHRTERVLIVMMVTIVGLSIAAFVARLVGQVVGVDDYSGGVWPLIGLPLAILLIIASVVVGVVRRSRASRDTTR
jgi:hypothetical protein